MKRLHEPIDRRPAIERRAGPGPREVAPFGEHTAGVAQAIDRSVGVAAEAAPSQGAPNPFRRIGERLLEPRSKRARVEAVGLGLRQHDEQRIDRRLDRAFAKQFRAKSVNRIDARFFERGERQLEARTFVAVRGRARVLERRAQA